LTDDFYYKSLKINVDSLKLKNAKKH
jgi:hypothetical protein